MTVEELASRRPVWIALSNLFLDTDVSSMHGSIAEALAASPYSLEELRAILADEVTPALQSNLLAVAGEWAGFDEDWVVERVRPNAGHRRWLPNLVRLDDDWKAIASRVENLRRNR